MVLHGSGHASIHFLTTPLSLGLEDGVRFPVSLVTMAFSKPDRCERNTRQLSNYGVGVCMQYGSLPRLREMPMPDIHIGHGNHNPNYTIHHTPVESNHKACQHPSPALGILWQENCIANSEFACPMMHPIPSGAIHFLAEHSVGSSSG